MDVVKKLAAVHGAPQLNGEVGWYKKARRGPGWVCYDAAGGYIGVTEEKPKRGHSAGACSGRARARIDADHPKRSLAAWRG